LMISPTLATPTTTRSTTADHLQPSSSTSIQVRNRG
jgi:hypothetical protein